jgi:hypothetical protein
MRYCFSLRPLCPLWFKKRKSTSENTEKNEENVQWLGSMKQLGESEIK